MIFVSLISDLNGYKILGVFPLILRSHDIFCQSVIKALLKRGHQVDVISTREMENPSKNYKLIYNIMEITPNITIDVSIDEVFSTYDRDPIKFMSHKFGNYLCELLANEKVQNVIKNLKTKSNYDLLITEV